MNGHLEGFTALLPHLTACYCLLEFTADFVFVYGPKPSINRQGFLIFLLSSITLLSPVLSSTLQLDIDLSFSR